MPTTMSGLTDQEVTISVVIKVNDPTATMEKTTASVERLTKAQAENAAAGEKMQQAAIDNASAQLQANDALYAQGARISAAVTGWDRLAAKYDDVTRASINMAQATANIDRALASYNNRIADATITTREKAEADAASVRVQEQLQQKLGQTTAKYLELRAAQQQSAATPTTQGASTSASLQSSLVPGTSQFEEAAGVAAKYTAQIVAANKAAEDGIIPAKNLGATLQAIYTNAAEAGRQLVAQIEATSAAYQEWLSRTVAAYQPAIAALRQYMGSVVDLQAQVDAGRMSQGQADDMLFDARKRYDDLAAAAEASAEAMRAAAEASKLSALNLQAPQTAPQLAGARADATAAFGPGLDQAAAQVNQVAAAEAALAQQQTVLNTLLATGDITAQQAAISLAKYQTAVDSAKQAEADAATASQRAMNARLAAIDPVFAANQRFQAKMVEINALEAEGALSAGRATQLRMDAAKATDTQTAAQEKNNLRLQNAIVATGGVTREFVVLGHEIVTGNYSRLAGSLIVISEYLGGLRTKIFDFLKDLGAGSALLGTAIAAIPIAIAATLALTATAAQHENAAMVDLANRARASRDDWNTVAESVKAAASAVSHTSTSISRADAIEVGSVIKASPSFSGDQAQLQSLIKLTADLAALMGKTLPEAAKATADALKDPAAEAKKLADEGFKGLNLQIAAEIDLMQKAGDVGGAQQRLFDAMRPAAEGAAEAHTKLGEAVAKLKQAFSDTEAGGKGFFSTIGHQVVEFTTSAINLLARLVQAMNEAHDATQKMIDADMERQRSAEAGIAPRPAEALPQNLFKMTTGGMSVAEQLAELQKQFPSLFVGGGTHPVLMDQTPGVAPGSIGHGLGQITPPTAAGYGFPTGFIDENAAQNLVALVGIINKLSLQPGATPRSIEQTYGGFKDTPESQARLTTKMAALGNEPIGNLPTDVVSGIKYLAGVYQWPDWLTTLALRMVSGESKGKQFDAGGITPAGQQAQNQRDVNFTNLGQQQVERLRVLPPLIAQNQAAQTANLAAQQVEQSKIDTAQLFGGPDQEAEVKKAQARIADLQQAYRNLKSEASNLITEEEKTTRALKDQTPVTQAETGAAREFAQIRQQAIIQAREHNGGIVDETQLTEKLNEKHVQLQAGFDEVIRTMDRKIAADDKVAAGWENGAAGAVRATAAAQAYTQVLQFADPKEADFADKVAKLTEKLIEQGAATEKIAAKQDQFHTKQQIDFIQAETDSLGQNFEAREAMLGHLKSEQDLREKYPHLIQSDIDALVAEHDQLEKNTRAYELQKQTLDFLSQQFSSAFDTIGNAITDAFVQGSGAAVNWGNITKAVISQVVKALLELAIVNPLKNAFSSTSNLPTLDNVLGLLGGGGVGGSGAAGVLGSGQSDTAVLAALRAGAGAGGSSGTGSLLSTGGSILGTGSSIAKLFGFDVTKSLGESLGLTGPGGLGETLFGSGATTGFIPGILQSGIGGTTVAQAAAANAAEGLATGTAGTIGPTGALGGASIGGLAGGAAAGFAAGSLVGGLVQSGAGKVGPAPTIGAAVGAVGGAVLGQILIPIPGVGALIGGLIGGTLGGGGGGLIGPKAPSPFSSTYVGVGAGGQLDLGRSISQLASTDADRKAAQANIDAINKILTDTGAIVSGVENVGGAGRRLSNAPGDIASFQVGINSPKGTADPSKFASFTDAFPNLRFTSPEAHMASFLQGAGFSSPQELSNVLTSVKGFIDATSGTDFASRIDTTLANARALGSAGTAISDYLARIQTFVTQTVPALLGSTEPMGSLATAINAVHASFDPAIATAHELAYKETELTDARQKALDAANDAATQQGITIAKANQQRIAVATNPSPFQTNANNLAAFDIAAKAQKDDLDKTLVGIYANPLAGVFAADVRKTEGYLGQVALLEEAQGAERVALVKAQQDQITALYQTTARSVQALVVRQFNAEVTLGQRDPLSATLYAFDTNAQQQREDYAKQLTDMWGPAFAASQAFADDMAQLEKTLGLERLVAVKQAGDAAAQATKAAADSAAQNATATIDSITQYARTLQIGQDAPLSPQDQYALAKRQFQAVSGAAAAGDYTSIQQLTSYADAFRTTSQTLFGSGVGYVADVKQILDGLNKVATMTPDALTASVLAQIQKTQTDTLMSGLEGLRTLLAQILLQFTQGQNKPGRLAA